MNTNIKTIFLISIALAVGLIAGFFLFGNGMANHTHDHAADTEGLKEETAGSEDIYTCSMHPQIRQNEPGDCAICGMDLIVLKENSSSDPLVLEMTTEAVKLSNIQTTIVGYGKSAEGNNSIRLSGKVQADERMASSQVAHVPGRLEKLYVSFTGEQVSKGQKLADIYSPDLVAAQQELLEAKALAAVSPALLEAARNKLRYWKIDAKTIEEIETSGTIRETFTLFANAAGIVTERRVAVGDYVGKGEPLFELMNLNKLWVLFDAYEEQLAQISLGNQIEFSTMAVPGRTFTSTVRFIDPVINPRTRVASVRLEVNNKQGLLKPEMLVYGTLQNTTGANSAMTIPKSAVLWTGTRSVVYVKLPETTIPSFQFREVEIGEGIGDSYPVLAGLEVGEEVVTYGSFSIDAAAQLNNQASMMNQDVSVKDVSVMEFLPDYTATTLPAFKTQLATQVESYLRLKDALVETDPAKASLQAATFSETLASVDMKLVEGEAHDYWMGQLEALQAHSDLLQAATDVEEQRQQFDFLSQALIDATKVFGIPEDTYYVQYCPMAFDNEGANWLSDEEQIANPYFGDKMLRCGLVTTTIDKDFKNPAPVVVK